MIISKYGLLILSINIVKRFSLLINLTYIDINWYSLLISFIDTDYRGHLTTMDSDRAAKVVWYRLVCIKGRRFQGEFEFDALKHVEHGFWKVLVRCLCAATRPGRVRLKLANKNEEQIITGYPIDGAMGSLVGEWVRKLSVVCLHNNAIVARGILVYIA